MMSPPTHMQWAELESEVMPNGSLIPTQNYLADMELRAEIWVELPGHVASIMTVTGCTAKLAVLINLWRGNWHSEIISTSLKTGVIGGY